MCGIAGTFGFGDPAVLRAMTDAIAHRGPDGEYFFHDEPVHLGSRRLAILDPAGGAQPMANEDGSVVVVYNGEIYNYPELRDHLLGCGHTLETHCDTELLPHLYEDEGIEFVQRLNGIFAFALWDTRKGKLYLVRDPLGVKPLVYARRDDRLAFASESKAILASGLVSAELDEVIGDRGVGCVGGSGGCAADGRAGCGDSPGREPHQGDQAVRREEDRVVSDHGPV